MNRSTPDVTPAPRCVACNAVDVHYVGHKNECAVHECRKCQVFFATVPPSDDTVQRGMYEHYYDRASFALSPAVRASLERLVRRAATFRKSGRWLDVGYGEGGLLSVAAEHGWNCHGIEISPPALAYGRRRGWIVTSDPSADPEFPVGDFDVVTMIEFVEHVPMPAEAFAAARRWLRPGGLLYVTTPNVRSLNRRILGLDWSVVSPPEHLVLWSRPALRDAVRRAGFITRSLRTEGCNPSEILARVRRRTSGPVSVDRNQAAFALNEAMSRSRVRRTAKVAANVLLSALGIGDTLKLWAIRKP